MLDGITVNPEPLQMVAVFAAMLGRGLTLTVTINVDSQLPDFAVTVYCTLRAPFVELVRFPVKLLWFDPVFEPDVTDNPAGSAGAVQLYVVPVGTISPPPLLGVSVNVEPLQTFIVFAAMLGVGLTVTVTVNGVPVQLPEPGVTVYVAVCTELVVFTSVPLILL